MTAGALRMTAVLIVACAPSPAPRPVAAPAPSHATSPRPELKRDVGDRTIRVLLAPGLTPRLSASTAWRLYESDGVSLSARGLASESWKLERDGRRIRAIRPDGVVTIWQSALVARVVDAGFVTFNNRRYRGDIRVSSSDSGFVVVNTVTIEDYLRGVVPAEIGRNRPATESAAVQAQAVAARSYAYTHLVEGARVWDVTAGTQDQVYDGVEGEAVVSNTAVDATRGLVLLYAGRVVNAPFHSTCGGQTAEAPEVWRAVGEPYLRRVSDRIPGTADRFYCDAAPRFRWTKTIEGAELNAAMDAYLKTYTVVPGGHPGRVRDIRVLNTTPSGRVAQMAVETDRGSFLVRGNDTRYVLRTLGGEILNSTYFSAVAEQGPDGSLARLVVRGSGYGHGVGMCQWGAIGRARAGQDVRTILQAYYPGTELGTVN
ncbi:MAG: SpoIID/LytB domain protein [Gemmatimonadetes bacterium]|nr:SpoIID/LytB domain protein [Gemmatimonadota bacterium]